MNLYILDTDHLSLYERNHPTVRERIVSIRRNSSVTLAITIISTEEQVAGRLAQVRKAATPQALIGAYQNLRQTLILFSDFQVLDYELNADEAFRKFRRDGIRIGTLDLRIASITLTHNGVLLTRNLKDFEQVPGLNI